MCDTFTDKLPAGAEKASDGRAKGRLRAPLRRKLPTKLAFPALLFYSAPVRVDTLGGNADEVLSGTSGFDERR
ncbi:MAG TPA: hypothetical protein DIC56_09325 [Rhizobium sp.]|nr:hypothetical protein [Rhizobium sp.]